VSHPVPPARVAPEPPGLRHVGQRIDARILLVLDAELARWRSVDDELAAPLDALRSLIAAGGKRLRPAFCHWAFVGSGGSPSDPRVVDAGAALELLHSFALVHDDVMDGSDQRRGLPAVHKHFVERHRSLGWHGDARRSGEGAAILVGDFAFVYADRILGDVPAAARAVFDELRLELCVGQYLDLVGTASASRDPVLAARIARYKSGKYTVERPLHLGAALAGADPAVYAALTAFGLPLGEAFQLRDDLLGVFGDSAVTGKPVGDDLREGKLTPLMAAASARASATEHACLARVGHADLSAAEIAAIQDALVTSGAVAEIEDRIAERVADALDALDRAPLGAEARAELAELTRFAAWRDR
jgi:geranylgeranyl diphosphate synthase type I